MELAKAVQQLAFLAELLQHVGQQLVGDRAFGRQAPVEIGLQFGQGFLGLAAAGGDAGQIEVQHGGVGRQGVGLAKGRLGLGEAVGHEERVSQRPIGHARLHVQQRRGRIALEANAFRMVEDIGDAGGLVGGLRVLARETVKLAKRIADVQLGDLVAGDRFVVRALGGAVPPRGDASEQLLRRLDGGRQIAVLHPVIGQQFQGLLRPPLRDRFPWPHSGRPGQ